MEGAALQLQQAQAKADSKIDITQLSAFAVASSMLNCSYGDAEEVDGPVPAADEDAPREKVPTYGHEHVLRTCREGEDAADEDAPRRRQGRRHSSCLGLLDRRRRLGFL